MYVLDSSALIDLRRDYPREVPVFRPIWDRMSALAASGDLIAPREVYREVEKGTDDAAVWVRLHETMFIEIDGELGAIMEEVWGQASEMDKEKSGPHADPWCVALAVREVRRGKGVHVITHERTRSPGRIPHACSIFNIPCIRLVDFFRMEEWPVPGR